MDPFVVKNVHKTKLNEEIPNFDIVVQIVMSLCIIFGICALTRIDKFWRFINKLTK
jgi:hypothetical protein